VYRAPVIVADVGAACPTGAFAERERRALTPRTGSTRSATPTPPTRVIFVAVLRGGVTCTLGQRLAFVLKYGCLPLVDV